MEPPIAIDSACPRIDLILCVLFLLLLSAFFSGAETALFSIPTVRLRTFQKEPYISSRLLIRLLSRPNRLLVAILTGNLIVNIAASSITGKYIQRFFMFLFGTSTTHELAAAIVSIVSFTLILLIFCEVGPKTIAVQLPERIARIASAPLFIATWLLTPVQLTLTSITNTLIKILHIERLIPPPSPSEDELRTLAHLGAQAGILGKDKSEMIRKIIGFPDVEVAEIMTPRSQIVALEYYKTIKDAFNVVKNKGMSRIPVFIDSIDNIVGILHIKDLFSFIKREEWKLEVGKICRRALFIPTHKRIGDLFAEMQLLRTHMAVVIGREGHTAGIVTLEDLLEEVVGEIVDEYEPPTRHSSEPEKEATEPK